jgi:MFS family permease
MPEVVEEHGSIQQRTLRVLWGSSMFSRGAVSAIFAVAVLAIKELLSEDNERWAGTSTAASTVGSAIAAALLAAYMQRKGRTLGLSLGLGVAVLGAVLCVISIEAGLLVPFLLGMVLVGVGSGASNLSRYAAADLAPAERRSRDISWRRVVSVVGWPGKRPG